MGPKACMHILDELFFIVALVDGAGQVMQFLFFNCGEDHAVA